MPHKGVHSSPATEFRPGQVPWNAGRYALKACATCGKEMRVQLHRAARTKCCSKACLHSSRGIYTKTFPAGASHPSFVDGNAGNGYPRAFNAALKRRIKERDGYACQLCGVGEADHLARTSRPLCVNHIDFDKKNCDERNLNTLCIGCNSRVNFDRPKWTAHFRALMEARHGG